MRKEKAVGNYHILNITDPGFNDSCWRKYYGLLEQLNIKYKSAFAKSSWKKLRNQLLSLCRANRHYYRAVIFENNASVCWIGSNVYNFGTNNQQMPLFIDALFDVIPNSLSMQLAHHISQLSMKYNNNDLHLLAKDQRISNLAREWKCKELGGIELFQLQRSKSDLNIINEWLSTIPAENKELHVEFHNFVPDEYLAQYTELYTQFLNDMPNERDSDKKFNVNEEDTRRNN